jgi:hypothetical protein
MLKQFKFTIDCLVTVRDITEQDAERAYRDDPHVGHYLAEPEVLQRVIAQQQRLLHAIVQQEEVLRRLLQRYIHDYIRDRLYDELPRPADVEEELFLVMAEAIDTLEFSDRMFYLAYAAPQAEQEEETDGDPLEQHTRLIRNSFEIKLVELKLRELV